MREDASLLTEEEKKISESITPLLQRVLIECLNAKKEELLIITDTGWEGKRIALILGTGYKIAGDTIGLKTTIVQQKPKMTSEPAEEQVLTALKNLPRKSIIIATLSNKLGQIRGLTRSYRNYLKIKNHRYVTTPSLGFLQTQNISLITKALDVNYTELREQHEIVRQQLINAKNIQVTTPAGTDFTITQAGTPISSNGDYRNPGTGGNLPAGEVYIPVENSRGTIIIDGSVRTSTNTYIIQKPVTLTILNGKVTSITEGTEAQDLKESIKKAQQKTKYPERILHIGEFGIGLNTNAQISGTTILDEKVYGTAHIALGSNYWFGGTNKTIIHLDQVFKNPTIIVDGKKLEI